MWAGLPWPAGAEWTPISTNIECRTAFQFLSSGSIAPHSSEKSIFHEMLSALAGSGIIKKPASLQLHYREDLVVARFMYMSMLPTCSSESLPQELLPAH